MKVNQEDFVICSRFTTFPNFTFLNYETHTDYCFHLPAYPVL